MTKSIIKRVIVGVLIAVILGFINSCEVKAQVYGVNPSRYVILDRNNPVTFSPNLNNISGTGYLVISAMLEQQVGDLLSPIYSATILQGGEYFGCSVGNLYAYSDAYGTSYAAQTVTCPINFDKGAGVGTLYLGVDVTINGVNYGADAKIILGRGYVYTEEEAQLLSSLLQTLQTTNLKLDNIYLTSLIPMKNALDNIYTRLGVTNDNQINIINGISNQTTSIINNQNTNAQNTQQKIDNINDTLKDDNVDNPQDYSSNVATNGVITQLITLPITLYQKILNSTSASCSPFNLGTLYGEQLTMPCINLQNYLGSTLFNVIDILISGLFIYSISRKMIKVFNSLSSMKESDVING